MSNDPRPKSPERLVLHPDVMARFVDGVVRIDATLTYEPWCCNGAHEVIDALQTLHDVIQKSAEHAERRRVRKIQKEIEESFGEVL